MRWILLLNTGVPDAPTRTQNLLCTTLLDFLTTPFPMDDIRKIKPWSTTSAYYGSSPKTVSRGVNDNISERSSEPSEVRSSTNFGASKGVSLSQQRIRISYKMVGDKGNFEKMKWTNQ
ncbi:hypothetical protein evm_007877 [Chilo suppressalis]|nr:hypothetical protein evm_007877 [Chilo suppressalis]